MIPFVFAAEASSSGIGALGISASAFIIQLLSFLIVFMLLKRFAFKPIIKLLEERRKTIDNGVKMGQQLEREKAKLDEQAKQIVRDARSEADKIVATGHKEARELVREAEKAASLKADDILAQAQLKINDETEHARRKLEKDMAVLVSDATETIVGEKIDAKKDKALIEQAMKGRK